MVLEVVYTTWYKFLAGAGLLLASIGTIYKNENVLYIGLVLLTTAVTFWSVVE